jgi:predicted MPP superfamily phosphohydrolase
MFRMHSVMAAIGFLVILLAFVGLDLVWWRAADRRLQPLRAASLWRALLAAFMGLMLLEVFLIAVWRTGISASQGPMPLPVHAVIYLWHFLVLPIVTAMLFAGALIRWARGKVSARLPVPHRAMSLAGISADVNPTALPELPAAPQTVPGPSRRQVLAAAAMAVPPLAACAVGAATVVQMRQWRLQKYTLPIPTLPKALDGLTIVQVSDTHIGKFLHPSRLPEIADSVNRLNADFVVFTGDLIDMSIVDLPYGIKFLQSLKARCGVTICEGNHDLFEDRGEFERRLRPAGLSLLLGGQQIFSCVPGANPGGRDFPVQFLGLPWNQTDPATNASMDCLRPLINPDAFPILLAHHPHAFDPAAAAGIPLTLSGHTHGGQIMFTPTIGAGPVRFRYISGLYQKPDSSLIVNNGLGNWFPLRLNAPAEIVHITLRSA